MNESIDSMVDVALIVAVAVAISVVLFFAISGKGNTGNVTDGTLFPAVTEGFVPPLRRLSVVKYELPHRGCVPGRRLLSFYVKKKEAKKRTPRDSACGSPALRKPFEDGHDSQKPLRCPSDLKTFPPLRRHRKGEEI